MADIIPFRGIFYNGEKIKDISKVVAPPYDVISPQDQDKYYQMSQYNIIRLILGKDLPGDNEANNKYTRARALFQDWLREKVLIRDRLPAIYLLEEEFEAGDSVFLGIGKSEGKRNKLTRIGFIALAKLEDFSRGIIKPHEGTMTEPKRDRLNLLRACKANFSPIFTLYEDIEDKIGKLKKEKKGQVPDIQFVNGENIKHTLWKINQEEVINWLISATKEKMLYIADGHHRYESALAYRNELSKMNPRHTGKELYNYVMTYFVSMKDKGLRIFPIHRAVRIPPQNVEEDLSKCFALEKVFDLNRMLERLKKEKGQHVIGMYLGGQKFYILKPRNAALLNFLGKGRDRPCSTFDVVTLHKVILDEALGFKGDEEDILYSEKVDEVVEKVRDGFFSVAFFLRPVGLSGFKKVIEAGERMPKKSTFFYPKLLSGLVINKLE